MTHIVKRHGGDNRTQGAISADDVVKARSMLAVGVISAGEPSVARSGAKRIRVEADLDGARYTAIFESGRKRVALHSLRKRGMPRSLVPEA